MSKSNLHNYFNTIASLASEEADAIDSLFTSRTMAKGEYLANEGKPCQEIAFIHRGYFRFFVTPDVDEITTLLAGPGEFISSFAGFLTRTAALESIQAVTEVEISAISFDNLQLLYHENPKFERIGRLIIEAYFVKKDRRLCSFIKDSAEDRYKFFLLQYPGFIKHIPLHYIASSLGITPETLSRIRAKVIS